MIPAKGKRFRLIQLTTPSPEPNPASGDIVITVQFNEAPTSATSAFPPLKYGKHSMIHLEWDDASRGALTALGIFNNKFYSDGAGNNKKYSLAVAVNGRYHFDNAEVGLEAARGIIYSEGMQVVAAGGDIENHGMYHDPSGTPGRTHPLAYISPLDMVKQLEALYFEKTGYRMNALVVPTNYPDFMQAAFQEGYVAASSTSSFDTFTPQPTTFTPTGVVGNIPEGFIAFKREFTDDWPSRLTDFKSYVDTLLTGTSETVNKWVRIGSHNLDNVASFTEFINYLQTQSNDRIWVTTMREFAEYRVVKAATIKSQQLVGNTLTITLDQSAISSRVRWRDLSLKITSDKIINSVNVQGADSFSYNSTTKLINVFKQDLSFGVQVVPPPVLVTPEAPTNLSVNDTTDVAGWVLTPGYAAGEHEYRYKPVGGTFTGWIQASTNSANLGNINIDPGDFQVRVMAGTNRNAGLVASSTTAFTVATTPPPVFESGTDDDPTYTTASESSRVTGDIPLIADDIYRLTTPAGYSEALLDNNSSTKVDDGSNNTIDPQFTFVRLRTHRGIVFNVKVRGYSSNAKYYLVKWPTFTRTQITNISAPVDGWVTLTPSTQEKSTYLVIEHRAGELPTDLKINGSYIPYTQSLLPVRTKKPFKNFVGNNLFEWDVAPNNDQNKVQETRYAVVDINHVIRHYLDWERLEQTSNIYTFAPTGMGGWNLDMMYSRFRADGKKILVCLKSVSAPIDATYPAEIKGHENIPAPWPGDNLTQAQRQAYWENPNSYLAKGKLAFQFAARYGNNQTVPIGLLTVWNSTNGALSWQANTTRRGLNLVDVMEGENERDKNWKWPRPERAYSTGRAHAAEMSAFYDGHMGTMGNNVGARTADPAMKVSMAGLAFPTVDYFKGMDDWFREYRGYNSDGTINRAYNIANFHHYANDGGDAQHSGVTKRGKRPELTNLKAAALKIIDWADREGGGMEVWQTESGYDISEFANQRAARPIDTSTNSNAFTRKLIQAEWSVALAMMYWSTGMDYFTFYSLRDTGPTDEYNQYARSGWDDDNGIENSGVYYFRPIANVFTQLKTFFYNYYHQETINQDPLIYKATDGVSIIYALVIPDEIARVANYELTLPPGFNKVKVWELDPYTTEPNVEVYSAPGGVITIPVFEMYIYVQPTNDAITITAPLKKASGITFILPPYKKESDADFAMVASSNNNESPITFESSNIAIATVNSNTLQILGPGLLDISAKQVTSTNYRAAFDRVVQLFILKENGEVPLTNTLTLGAWVRTGNNYSLEAFTPNWNSTVVFNAIIPAGQSGYAQMVVLADGTNTGALGIDPTSTANGPNDFDFVLWMNSTNRAEAKYAGAYAGISPTIGLSILRIRVDAINAYYEYSADAGITFNIFITKPRPNVDLYVKGWGTTPQKLTDVSFKLG